MERAAGSLMTILFTHGNAEDLGQVRGWMKVVSDSVGVNVMSYDYEGYGQNRGVCSEMNCNRDIERVWEWLTRVKGIEPHSIILMGRSIGTGPTTHLASLLSRRHNQQPPHQHNSSISNSSSDQQQQHHHSVGFDDGEEQEKKQEMFGGVVLQSGMSSCVRVMSQALSHLPMTDMFDNIEKIGDVRRPVMIVHGKMDNVIPFEHGQALWDRVMPEMKWKFVQLEKAGHNDIELNCRQQLLSSLSQFVDFLYHHPPSS